MNFFSYPLDLIPSKEREIFLRHCTEDDLKILTGKVRPRFADYLRLGELAGALHLYFLSCALEQEMAVLFPDRYAYLTRLESVDPEDAQEQLILDAEEYLERLAQYDGIF